MPEGVWLLWPFVPLPLTCFYLLNLIGAQRDQIMMVNLRGRLFWFLGLLSHFRNGEAAQNLLNALIYFPQRLTHGAFHALIASVAGVAARGDEQRTINSFNDLQDADLLRSSRQSISAFGTVMRHQQTALHQLLENLSQSRRRDAVSVGNVFSAARTRVTTFSQMLYSNQAVIGFFGQFQHSRQQLRPIWSHIDSRRRASISQVDAGNGINWRPKANSCTLNGLRNRAEKVVFLAGLRPQHKISAAGCADSASALLDQMCRKQDFKYSLYEPVYNCREAQ